MAKQSDPNLLRCLAIQQPWAWAVCTGIKTVENRTQLTPHVGQDIAILASTTRTNVNSLIREHPNLSVDFFTFGAIIGVARLADATEMNPKLEDNPSAIGPFCWILENPRRLPKPIPSKGRQNLLYWLTEVESNAVRSQLSGLRLQPLTSDGQAWAAAYHAACAVGHCAARGDVYSQLGQFDDAIRNFDLALQEQPDDVESLMGRAIAYLRGPRDAASVIRDCTAALRLRPDVAGLHMLRREAYRLNGDHIQAAADRLLAEALDPQFVAEWQDEDWN